MESKTIGFFDLDSSQASAFFGHRVSTGKFAAQGSAEMDALVYPASSASIPENRDGEVAREHSLVLAGAVGWPSVCNHLIQ